MSQESVSSLQHADSESESSFEAVVSSPACKRARNAAHEALALMVENDEQQRRSDDHYRAESLRIQQDMLNLGSSLFSTMTTDLRDMRTRFDSMESSLNRVVSLLTSQLSQPSAASYVGSMPTVPEEPRTPQLARASSVASSGSVTPTQRSPSQRPSSRARSQPRGGPYGGFVR